MLPQIDMWTFISLLICFILCTEGKIWERALCIVSHDTHHLSGMSHLRQCFTKNYGLGNESVCYGVLGCFPMEYPWVTPHRPFPFPYPPEDIVTGITLYTRNNPEGFNVILWPRISLENSDFKPCRKATLFLTHGFASNGRSDWLMDMKNAILDREDANVFVVDWEKGAPELNYLQAASNTRIVGAELVRFGEHLLKIGLRTTQMHLIGHSLGAHIMGYFGKGFKTKSKIWRITALDPAQPGFEGKHELVRLNKDDALFIDVIHTDARPFLPFLGFGMIQPVGDVDFYVNGGSHQPGCYSVDFKKISSFTELAKVPMKWLSGLLSCSHGRSHEYFTSALKRPNCAMVGIKVSDSKELPSGTFGAQLPELKKLDECDYNTCTVVGMDTFKIRARGVFLVSTNSVEPFCETSAERVRILMDNGTGDWCNIEEGGDSTAQQGSSNHC